jgi:1-deoxy-D-xylulose-5-phosphate reductoisomerase
MKKQIAILGSTGSIGRQALEVIEAFPNMFEVHTITANNSAELLIEQAIKFVPDTVVIANEDLYETVSNALSDLPIKVYAGSDAIAEAVEAEPIDIVLTAMMGYSGLLPTIKAIKAGKKIALANKETLVVAGELITQLAIDYKAQIIPVDSEHSAIFQCLTGEEYNNIDKIILTASGGPFLRYSEEQLKYVTKADALKHPNWVMGAKITIDSASLMNKGFEMIEAKWLFGVTPQQVEVVVHPQSIIHSMVQFDDGAVKAQLGTPDMKLPIAYAFTFPKRFNFGGKKLSLSDYASMTFERPDTERFPMLKFAYDAIDKGGNMPCILNAANEIAVAAFLEERIKFTDIPTLALSAMQKVDFINSPVYEDYVETDKATRIYTKELIKKL